jgi:large subunit ribosomal protein L32
MGNPKHKVTKSKQGHRRGHDTPSILAYGKCSKCGEIKQAHTVCPACGHYDNKEYIKKKEL